MKKFVKNLVHPVSAKNLLVLIKNALFRFFRSRNVFVPENQCVMKQQPMIVIYPRWLQTLELSLTPKRLFASLNGNMS